MKSYSIKMRAKLQLTADQSKIIVHQGTNGKNSSGIHSGSNNFQPNFIIRMNDNVLILRLVAWWLHIRTKLHISRDGLKYKKIVENYNNVNSQKCILHDGK